MWGQWLAEAAQLAQGADPAAARPLVERLLGQRPDDADALTLAGIVAQRTGRSADAIAAFCRAVGADPGNPARHQNLAVALKNDGQFAAARAGFEQALRLRPDHPGTLANLGSCLVEMDLPAEALAVLHRAGEHPDALVNMGVALVRLGRPAEAITAYRRALALRPGYVDTTINLADALLATGDAGAAAELLGDVLRRAPHHPRAANQLGLLHERQGAFDLAVAVLEPAFVPAAPHHALGVNLARLLVRAGRADEAIAVADRLIATQPSVTTPLALKAAALSRAGAGEALAELMALDRFVTIIDVTHVPGQADVAAFNRALIAELRDHPSLTFEPEGLVTRQGRQSDDLAGDTTPAIAALAELARTALGAARERLARQPADHPFLAALPEAWSLTLWGTILQPGGEVGSHIHAPNWLSGVYYPAFDGDDGSAAGAFGIGLLPAELGGGGELTTYRPAAGRMILFPSYLWHATLPFGGAAERVSFAFDLVPAGVGRPHRLPGA